VAIACAVASRAAAIGAGLAALAIAAVATKHAGLWTFSALLPLFWGIDLIYMGIGGLWSRPYTRRRSARQE
jgi:hypothetical protein